MTNAQIGPREDYTSAVITIAQPPAPGQPYPLQLEIPGARWFPPVQLTLDLPALDLLLAQPEDFGRALGQAVFAPDTLAVPYGEVLAVCQGRGDGLRVRLVIDPPELQGLPWERLFHLLDGKWQPLGAAAITPFSRYVRPQQWTRPQPITRRPLRVLAVIASPADLDRARLDPIPPAERQQLKDTFAALPDLQVTYLESGSPTPASLDEIRKALAEGYDFVHFLCHGVRRKAGTALFLEDAQGKIDIVTAERLVEAFKAVQAPPVFTFLTACESAARASADAFLPLGPALVADGGVQAVVAMTGRVGIELARAFTAQFYTRLFKHGQVDLAINEARALVRDDWDWGVPVLFSRLSDNQLIDFPVGQIYDAYLSHSEQAFAAVDEAIQAARLEEHGEGLVRSLDELVADLRKSHGALVKVASDYRQTGQDPASFKDSFTQFYYPFKQYYDEETWVDEQTSCGRIAALRAKILPRLAPLLNETAMDQLRQEMDILSNFDLDLIRHFQAYLDQMDAVVEQVWAALNAGQVEEAIQIKRDFEAQISPSFRRSKEIFERMGQSVRGVQAA